jgi:hypothetical protein
MWLYWLVFINKRVYRILQERVKPLGYLKRYTTNWYQSNWYTTMIDWKDLDHDSQNNPNLLQSMERIECEYKLDKTSGLGHEKGK